MPPVGKQEQPGMHQRLEFLDGMENYSKWIFRLSKEFLGDRVLDFGSGIGSITKFFLDKELVVGVDSLPENISAMKSRFAYNKNFHAMLFDAEKDNYSSIAGFSFDTVFCSNVLEHLEYDEQVLKNIHGILPKNGKLILFVPAHQWLFGSMDAGMHYRRYGVQDLGKKLRRVGFSVEKIKFANFPGLFYWFFFGKILKKTSGQFVEKTSKNRIIDSFAGLYQKIECMFSPPTGLSIFCVAVKK